MYCFIYNKLPDTWRSGKLENESLRVKLWSYTNTQLHYQSLT